MKKNFTLLLLSIVVTSALLYSQVHVGAKFIPKGTLLKPDTAYSNDIGIRGAWVAPDLDHDGKPEILVTDYAKTGRVHAFQAVNNDTLEWIWSSPRLDLVAGTPYGTGGNSTPRTIRTGDLDGDGKGEIIFPRALAGGVPASFLVFEWDGVNGSHKFGTIPSAVVPNDVTYGSAFGAKAGTPIEGGLQSTVEHFEVADVDGDGKQELLLPKNLSGSANDDFLAISANGTWEFESQGFASFEIEGSTGLIASTSFGGGSPYNIHPADLNGDGKKELVLANYNFGDYWVMKVTGANTYVVPDTNGGTSNGKQYYQMTSPTDDVALFGGVVGDLDKDGNEEVYLPFFVSGGLYVIDYKPGDDLSKADSSHAKRIASSVTQSVSGATIGSFNAVIGDLDRNGKREILVAGSYPSNVVGIEYNGTGSISDSNSYTRKVFYKGESDIYATVNYRDSLAVKDTVRTIGEGFVSKMTNPVDIDGDGKVEIVLPYQSLNDTATISWSHFDTGTSAFVVDSSKKVSNPKKWGFRLLESDIAGSVENHEFAIITPDDYQLNQNFPNPFNPTTTISFVLPLAKKVSLRIYDMLGKEVVSLANNQDFSKGSHTMSWNGRDQSGKTVASGAYIAKMSAGNVEKSIKMMLVK